MFYEKRPPAQVRSQVNINVRSRQLITRRAHMRIKTFLIATLIIGAMTFPFRRNAMPVITHSASPATLTATAAAAQDINPLASYDFGITDFNPYSLLFGRNVLPGATHS